MKNWNNKILIKIKEGKRRKISTGKERRRREKRRGTEGGREEEGRGKGEKGRRKRTE